MLMRIVESSDGTGVNIIVGNYGAFFPNEWAREARFVVEKGNEEFCRVLGVDVVAGSHPSGSVSQAVGAGSQKPDFPPKPIPKEGLY